LNEELKVKNNFLKSEFFNRVFGQKTIDFNWCLNTKITTLFIAELYG